MCIYVCAYIYVCVVIACMEHEIECQSAGMHDLP